LSTVEQIARRAKWGQSEQDELLGLIAQARAMSAERGDAVIAK
jgi:hypothetical protein